MYKAFYGLKDDPFSITPDPRFLYWSPKHQEAFRHLVYGVQGNKGLVVLTGEPGTGKTAILHAVAEHLRNVYTEMHLAFLVNSKISVQDLFRLIFDEFHIERTFDNKSAYLINFKKFLTKNHLNGEKSVLILDEAQNFHPTILEEIRLLSNMETTAEKLLHIFLVGQPKLLDHINTPELHQLKQRLGIIYKLLPLDRLEMELYIHKRLSVAGAPDVNLFAADALDEIFAYTRGLPRLINVVCDNALLFGCAAQMSSVTKEIIQRVGQELDLSLLEESTVTSHASLPPTVTPPLASSALVSPAMRQQALPRGRQESEAIPPATTDDIILQNATFSIKDWDDLLSHKAAAETGLQQAWYRTTRPFFAQYAGRFLFVTLVLLGLLAVLIGEQWGAWSLRASVSKIMETINQQIMLRIEAPANLEHSRGLAKDQGDGRVVSPRPLASAEGHQALLPTSGQVGAGEKKLVGKKVIVRSGDSLSKILTREYGEYSKPLLDLVTEANPGLRESTILVVGQSLILPERLQ